jgi:archaellum component FlaD/FlaE
LVVLALIPLLIDRVAGLDLPVEVIVTITISLKWLDKYLHKYGKENDVEELVKGITRF